MQRDVSLVADLDATQHQTATRCQFDVFEFDTSLPRSVARSIRTEP